jgi:hypothetical protein
LRVFNVCEGLLLIHNRKYTMFWRFNRWCPRCPRHRDSTALCPLKTPRLFARQLSRRHEENHEPPAPFFPTKRIVVQAQICFIKPVSYHGRTRPQAARFLFIL